MLPKRPQSPYSTSSDIGHLLGRASPTGLPPLADAIIAGKTVNSKDRTLVSNADVTGLARKTGNSNFANEIKTIQQKIMDELKTNDILDPTNVSRVLEQSTKMSSFSEPFTTTNIAGMTSSVEQPGGGAAGPNKLKKLFYPEEIVGRPRLYDDRRGFELSANVRLNNSKMPFKSYEYESLNPVRYGPEKDKFRLSRPYSSVSFYNSAQDALALDSLNSLRESSISNYMNSNTTAALRSNLVSLSLKLLLP